MRRIGRRANRNLTSWGLVFGVFIILFSGVDDACLRAAEDDNPFTYLDEYSNPYYAHTAFPKLTTPQWVGEPGVEAVVVLGIDDMQDSAKYEAYLRPILNLDGFLDVMIGNEQRSLVCGRSHVGPERGYQPPAGWCGSANIFAIDW
ncbi:MAG: hypothetical protein R3C09_00065 [Pirellulaceae bacterium]